jgi:hypothetical protein
MMTPVASAIKRLRLLNIFFKIAHMLKRFEVHASRRFLILLQVHFLLSQLNIDGPRQEEDLTKLFEERKYPSLPKLRGTSENKGEEGSSITGLFSQFSYSS